MYKQKAIIVVGYNNTRIVDVRKIRKIAQEKLDAITILCKSSLLPTGIEVVDRAIEVQLTAKLDILQYIVQECQDFDILAIVPFSDAGVPLGAMLAEHFFVRSPKNADWRSIR